MGPTWGPSGADRTQVGPMFAPRTLLSGNITYSNTVRMAEHNSDFELSRMAYGFLLWVFWRKIDHVIRALHCNKNPYTWRDCLYIELEPTSQNYCNHNHSGSHPSQVLVRPWSRHLLVTYRMFVVNYLWPSCQPWITVWGGHGDWAVKNNRVRNGD